jgi:hypothetical protein
MVAVRWYLRYGLSYRDVEELLAERGITVDQPTNAPHGGADNSSRARTFCSAPHLGCGARLLATVGGLRTRELYWARSVEGGLYSGRPLG